MAGGTGSRLAPITLAVSKQLLPIHNKPMIYYPIGTMMLAGIREILLISTARDLKSFQTLFGDGSNFGISIEYQIQSQPKGIAEAFIIGSDFVGNQDVALILGDNIFHGTGLGHQLSTFTSPINAGNIFGYQVQNPKEYGVVEFGPDGKVLSIEEKPAIPKSNFAIPGLYFYKSVVTDVAKEVRPSPRGELEITSINQYFLAQNQLGAQILPRGTAWLDTGTVESLDAASSYVRVIEGRQGNMICCLEEIALQQGWVSPESVLKNISLRTDNHYYSYVKRVTNEYTQ